MNNSRHLFLITGFRKRFREASVEFCGVWDDYSRYVPWWIVQYLCEFSIPVRERFTV
jgi:hypothetical protein